MRHNKRQTLAAPSILDHLMDDQPEVNGELAQHYDLHRYKQAVARDLQFLLNTRCIDLNDELEDYPYVSKSMLSYGTIDLSSLSLLNPSDQVLLRDKITITIARHEPRLTRVRVMLDGEIGQERVLRFRVETVLVIHPSRPLIIFDAMLQLSSNSYQVKEN